MAFAVLLTTALIICLCMAVAFARTRDPLHPLMFLGPMFLYVNVVRPGVLLASGEMERFFPDESRLVLVLLLFGAGVVLFCLGALRATGPARALAGRRIGFDVPEPVRVRLCQLGMFLGWTAIAAYLFAVFSSGGFWKVYSSAKGHYNAGTGYVNEAVNFAIPAVALVLLSSKGEARYRHHFVWALFFASPVLVHGLLGARRGPTFIICAAILVSSYLVAKRRPSVFKVLTRFALVAALVFVLFSHRSQIYLGSEFEFDWSRFTAAIAPEEATGGDDVVFPYGLVATAQHTGRHPWGLRYAATYFVRPIPRQLWPTKYSDLGLGWMVDQHRVGGFTDAEWKEAVGWLPLRGSAGGFVADLFLEFSWGSLVFCYLFGWFYGFLWKKSATLGGLWTLHFIQAAAPSDYVPTQSVSAVFHRFLFMTIPTLLLWRFFIAPPGATGVSFARGRSRPPIVLVRRLAASPRGVSRSS